jgi:hypothetical protein
VRRIYKVKKEIKITLMVLGIVLLLFIAYVIFEFILKENECWITDNEFLYDKAISYLENEENEYLKDKNLENYKVFTDYDGFGITEKGNKKYVYMWILKETYYIQDDEVKMYQGSSMAYKFTFENNEVIEYEIPKDGSDYTSSIKDMFPNSIENKIFNHQKSNSELRKKVQEYYNK